MNEHEKKGEGAVAGTKGVVAASASESNNNSNTMSTNTKTPGEAQGDHGSPSAAATPKHDDKTSIENHETQQAQINWLTSNFWYVWIFFAHYRHNTYAPFDLLTHKH